MAEQLLEQVRDVVDGQIVCAPTPNRAGHDKTAANTWQDFEGQKLVELINTVALTAVGVSLCHCYSTMSCA